MNEAWRNQNPWAIRDAERRDRRIVSEPPREAGKMTQLLTWAKTRLKDVAAPGVDVGSLVQMARTRDELALTRALQLPHQPA